MPIRLRYDEYGGPGGFAVDATPRPNTYHPSAMDSGPQGLSAGQRAQLRTQIEDSGSQVFECEHVPTGESTYQHQSSYPLTIHSSGNGIGVSAVGRNGGYHTMGNQYPGMDQYGEPTQMLPRYMAPKQMGLQARGRYMTLEAQQPGRGGFIAPQQMQRRGLEGQAVPAQMQQQGLGEMTKAQREQHQRQLQRQEQQIQRAREQVPQSQYPGVPTSYPLPQQQTAAFKQNRARPHPYPLPQGPQAPGTQAQQMATPRPHPSIASRCRADSIPPYLPFGDNSYHANPLFSHAHVPGRRQGDFEPVGYRSGSTLNPMAPSYTPAPSTASDREEIQSSPLSSHPSPHVSETFETISADHVSRHTASASPPLQRAPVAVMQVPVAVMQTPVVSPPVACPPLPAHPVPSAEAVATKPSRRAALLGRCADCIQRHVKCLHITAPPSGGEFKQLAKPTKTDGPAALTAHFLNKLHTRFRGRSDDHATLATLERDMSLLEDSEIDDEDFFVRAYKVLSRGDSLDLLPDFHKLVRFRRAKLLRLREKAERELSREDSPAAAKRTVMRPSKRKARPVNALKGSEIIDLGDDTDEQEDVEEEAEAAVDDIEEPQSDCDAPQDDLHPSDQSDCSHDTENTSTGGVNTNNAKTPSSKSRKAPTSSSNRKTRSSGKDKQAASVKKVKKRPSSKTDGIRKSIREKRTPLGHMLSTEVPHVGPVYADRRLVLRRESNPYVHFCGRAFPHPQDVRAHHSKAKCFDKGAESRAWNEHPSCHIDYPDISYAKVSDGYVILDQASQNRLDAAIALGEACTERKFGNIVKGVAEEDSEVADDAEEENHSVEVRKVKHESDSEQDAEFEIDDDYGYQATGRSMITSSPTVVNQPAPVPAAGPVNNSRERTASTAVGGLTKKVILRMNSSKTKSLDSSAKTKGSPAQIAVANTGLKFLSPTAKTVALRDLELFANTDVDEMESLDSASRAVTRSATKVTKAGTHKMKSIAPASKAFTRPFPNLAPKIRDDEYESFDSVSKTTVHPDEGINRDVDREFNMVDTMGVFNTVSQSNKRGPPKRPTQRRKRKAPMDTGSDEADSSGTASKRAKNFSKSETKAVNDEVKPPRVTVKAGPD